MKILLTALTTLIVITPFNTPPGDDVFITGDFMNCNWRPDCIKLNRVRENQFKVDLPLEEGTKFKITRGSWAQEVANSWGALLPNLEFSHRRGNEPIFVDIRNWKDQGSLKVTGNIQVVKNFYSPELGNIRDLHIRLPENYKNSDKSYPVIYMHDGQNVFDPKTSTFGTDWSVDEVLSRLENEGKVREAIVVGIFHKERHREYNDEDLGELYGKFIVETLKPLIDKNLRTLPDRDHTFLMGSSYGSAISVSLAFRHPEVFGKVAGLSFNASFFKDMLFRLSDRLPMTSTELYLDHGTRGGDQKFGRHFQRFKKHLFARGLAQGQITYRVFKDTNHTEADWARRVHIPLKFLLRLKAQ